jgi:uncharacterized protein (DUF697 family)
MIPSDNQLAALDREADKVIATWSAGALGANLLPPPFDSLAVSSVFAGMGARLSDIYGVDVDVKVIKNLGRSMAKGMGAVLTASYIGTGLFKYVPGVNIWVALLIQPPIVAAVAYSVGNAFKRYFRVILTEGRVLSAEEMRVLAEASLRASLRS